MVLHNVGLTVQRLQCQWVRVCPIYVRLCWLMPGALVRHLHLHLHMHPCRPCCSIVAEAYNLGWVATRWIPAGVGVYMGFLLLAPRLHVRLAQSLRMTAA